MLLLLLKHLLLLHRLCLWCQVAQRMRIRHAASHTLTSHLRRHATHLSPRMLTTHGGRTSVEFLPLDIGRKESVTGLIDELKKRHPGGVDVVVNNAGVALQGFGECFVPSTF